MKINRFLTKSFHMYMYRFGSKHIFYASAFSFLLLLKNQIINYYTHDDVFSFNKLYNLIPKIFSRKMMIMIPSFIK